MINVIKADFKKMYYLSSYLHYVLAIGLLSILFGFTFLFTIGVTQGKELTQLAGLEVMDITLLGMDIAAIMLIIFAASFISNEFTSGSICPSLAITPLRHRYYFSKMIFIAVLSLLVSITLTVIFFGLSNLVLSVNNMKTVPIFQQALLLKFIGALFLPLFYSVLSAAAAFYFQSASGGTTFALGVMFLPAFIKMFPAGVSDVLLTVLPERSLHTLSEAGAAGQWLSAASILLGWIVISSFMGLSKLKRTDF
ncbi:hypothetical protein [Salibacterium aidingense]|uniref:hypothetical protein n=1 Tax=Salibacterium aidingense TaxID=384933 RepID=UPI003BC1A2AA